MLKDNSEHTKQGSVLALDLGEKLVGIAITDDLRITLNRLDPMSRTNWKKLLRDVSALVQRFDAQTLVIGLPLSLDGTTGPAAANVQQLARNFARSLQIPVYLQDERLTSFEARNALQAEGYDEDEISRLIDSEAAAIILRDFLNNSQDVLPISVADPDDPKCLNES